MTALLKTPLGNPCDTEVKKGIPLGVPLILQDTFSVSLYCHYKPTLIQRPLSQICT